MSSKKNKGLGKGLSALFGEQKSVSVFSEFFSLRHRGPEEKEEEG